MTTLLPAGLCGVTAVTETMCFQAVASQWLYMLMKLFWLSAEMQQYL
jgi:hypothetical protein